MGRDRLDLLYLTLFPPSPPACGAQRRIDGLMRALSRRHDITAITLLPEGHDGSAAERAMREYCREIALVPAPPGQGPRKRLLQLRSLLSIHSFERHNSDSRSLRKVLDSFLSKRAFDIVEAEFPFLAPRGLRKAPPGAPAPKLVLDAHNIEFDLGRQQTADDLGLARRLYNGINYRKLRREERSVWRRFDGVAFCSAADEERARTFEPGVRSAVVPNAVDLDYFKTGPGHPLPDGCTVIFFGAIDYFPNRDGLLYLLREVWPRIEKTHPRARLKIVGRHPLPELLAFQGPRVEFAGEVDDLRPHLARAAVSIVPLRIGGGTRFKVLEAMAMEKPVVSTSIGAEGISVEHDRNVLLADDAASFAGAVGRTLDDANLRGRLGKEGRSLVERHYSWNAVAQRLDVFFRELLAA